MRTYLPKPFLALPHSISVDGNGLAATGRMDAPTASPLSGGIGG